jgi:hypothetical protein
MRARNWTAGLRAAACVLPFSGLASLLADQDCNHLEGDIMVAEAGTPRGDLCDAIQWDQRWLLLLLVPPALAFLAALLTGRGSWLYKAILGIGAALPFVAVAWLESLEAYFEI